MSGDVVAGSPRPRPLSGGFWTLLSWLRREEQSSSNESLSSAGSDRTAASFAFLAPAHYHSRAPPIILPPPGPPTDTYKNRVRERNLRRQYDRDITLHRKYGLFRGEGASAYDAFSLPPARRGGASGDRRERRAASECSPRRVHVPGKRRAPPPPGLCAPGARRQTRKRPAPQPPTDHFQNSKENIKRNDINVVQMSDRSPCDEREVRSAGVFVDPECKPEKYTRKDSRDGKARPEKSFLKQIFENRKRNSTVDISAVKILPSISELDKQAAEIIENNKIKNCEDKNRQRLSKESVSCPKCLKELCVCKNMLPSCSNHIHHQNASTTCTQTDSDLPNTALNKNIKEDEKQKLKDMLKEMKDSLPKRPKHENKVNNIQTKTKGSPIISGRAISITDSPTLRIGSSNSHQAYKSSPVSCAKDKQVINQNKVEVSATRSTYDANPPVIVQDKCKSNAQLPITLTDKATNNQENKKLHTPLKISSLLNPIYVPRHTASPLQQSPKTLITDVNNENKTSLPTISPGDPIYVKTADTVRDIILSSAITGNPIPSSQQLKSIKPLSMKSQSCSNENPSVSKELPTKLSDPPNNSSMSNNKNASNVTRPSEHTRRRELINQLEQSIAKGDERAAADAATKLAQLKLSCSVLSFSSQILGEPSTSSAKLAETLISPVQNKDVKNKNDKGPNKPTEPLPDLIKREVVSSKKNECNQTSETKVLHVTKCPSPELVQSSEKNDVGKLFSAQASTSKDITKNKIVGNNMASLKIWIEDKEKARGPIQISVRPEANVGDLRRQAEQSLGLPARLQRWIVGRTLCTNDNIPLISLAGPNLNAPFYLCLVESDTTNAEVQGLKPSKIKEEIETVKQLQNDEKKSSDVYSELVNLERQALVPNTEMFECDICMEPCDSGNGVVLRECVHSFCKDCLSDVIRHCEEPTVACPATGCPGELHEREIRALVSAEEYQRWLARGLAAAESGTRNAFHCRTADCTGWALCEIDVRRFPCPVCKHTNCVPCKAIHENQNCEQYQAKLLEARTMITTVKTDDSTQALIEGLITRGEALRCPECSAVITKKWGCDWVKCSACKTEICWVTRGRRWGPGGRGDTSGGCRCGVDGKRCHPTCGYCH